MSEETKEQGGELLLDDSFFEAGSESDVEIGVLRPKAHDSDPDVKVGMMYLRHVKMPVIDTYRDKRNGTGRGKGDKSAAREYLFRKTFIRFVPLPQPVVDEQGQQLFDDDKPKMVNARLSLNGHKTEIEFFVAKEKLVDRVLIEYLERTYPDLDLSKG